VGFRAQAKRYIITGLSVLATILMSGTMAHAASNSVVPCDQVGRDLKSLEVAVDTLPVVEVDHTPIDPDSLDEPRADTASATPVLDLTPRVTNILREVFGTTNEELPQETSPQPSSSPVADSDQESSASVPADTEIERNELPRFQQQMFRTDI
jgi:hypothetical protein